MGIPVQDITFRQGQNWLIEFSPHDEDDDPLPLPEGSDVEFRINSPIDGVATNVLTLDTSHGIVIEDPLTGLSTILVTEAHQTEANLVPGGIFYYEVRVIINNIPSPQIEGKLLVEPSLFATVVDPLLEEFNARFTEFTENDLQKSLMLHDARHVVEKNPIWDADDIPLAILYLAAHLLMMRKIAVTKYAAGGVDVGGVRSISVEDRTLTFNTNQNRQTDLSKTGMAQTTYGQEYLSMLRRYPVFIMRA